MNIHQIHFREKVTQDENPNPEWLNGEIAGFNVEDSRKDAYLPLSPEHFAEMEKQNKTSEYRSYLIEDVERPWFLNTQDKLVTHMAVVELGQLHEDKKPDGTPKRKWKYPITTFYKLNTPLYLKDRHLEGRNPQGPVYMTSKPNVKMTKLWSHRHKGVWETVTDPDKLEQAIETINEPDGVLVPDPIGDTWEAIPIETWGPPNPEMPKLPTPPPPTRTEEQEHAMKHWSFCRNPDYKYHRGNQSYYV